MPAPAHVRLTYSGTLGASVGVGEDWSINLSFSRPVNGATPTITALKAFADSARASIETNMANRFTSVCALTRTRAAFVGDNGLVPRNAAGTFLQADNVTSLAWAPASQLPFQDTVVVSLQSLSSGPTGKGRIFLPAPNVGVLGNDGRLAAATATTIRDACRTWLASLATNAAASGFEGLVIASGGSVSRGVPPGLRPVTSIAVGRAIDTQRRRRANVPEEKVFVSLF